MFLPYGNNSCECHGNSFATVSKPENSLVFIGNPKSIDRDDDGKMYVYAKQFSIFTLCVETDGLETLLSVEVSTLVEFPSET